MAIPKLKMLCQKLKEKKPEPSQSCLLLSLRHLKRMYTMYGKKVYSHGWDLRNCTFHY